MKHLNISMILIMLMSMVGIEAFAHDFEAPNADGVTIYYVKTSDTEVAVSYQGISVKSFYNEYTDNVTIPESVTNDDVTYRVTSIGSNAFAQCTFLKSVTIPNSVTSIGSNAFAQCTFLKSVTIGNSVKTIGDYAFDYCCSLVSVDIPNSVTSIGEKAFQQCNELISLTIGNSVTTIGSYAFSLCSVLTSIEIPNSVTTIGDYAFYGCDGLASVIIGNSVTTIGKSAFSGLSGLTSITIPNSVTTIGSDAFRNCSGLTSVTIGNSVTSIGEYAFYSCSGLTSVTIPNSVTSIGNFAFSDCSGLTSVNVPVTDFSAFCNNQVVGLIASKIGKPVYLIDKDGNEIKEYVIPEDVTSIGERAFYNCSGLTSVTIGNSVTSIGSDAFKGCDGINSVVFHCKETASWFSGFSSIKEVIIGDEVTSIANNAFKGCTGLTSLTIGNNVTTIGNQAFDGCDGLTSLTFHCKEIGSLFNYDGNPSIKEVIIGDEVTSIGEMAFYGFSGLTTIEIPNSVTSIGSSAFRSCSGLTSIEIPNSVTSIGDYAFRSCSGLTSIEIPNSVTSIGDYAFEYYSGLNSVTIGKSIGTSSSVGYDAFYGCDGLTSLTFHCPKIGSWFSGISSIKEVIIGDEVTSIGGWAFHGCSGLNSIEIPNSVTSIGSSAFGYCSGLTSIEIPNSVTSIGGYAFEYCSGLTSVTIGNSVTSIGDYAFYGCDGLASVTFHCPEIGYWFSDFSSIKEVIIGDEVTKIGDWAFHGCSGLTDVFSYTKSVLSIGSVFGGYQNKATLHVPYALYEQYKESEYWKNFGKIVNFEGLYNVIYMVDSEEFKKSVVEYGTAITAEEEPTKEGYTFSGWSEIPETMPANDITVTGTFTVNKYKLVYQVDGEEYKSSEIEYGTAITAEEEPTKEGYTFSGWSEIPETMPANDVTVIGTFTVNKYKLVYQVDGEEYKSSEIEYGTAITAEEEPTKEGYTFSGWSEIPETMPAHDVIITGTFEKDITLGDANGDGVVNVTDIVEIVNYILGHPSAKFNKAAADVNNDGVVNVTDIVSVVNIILSSNARELTNRAAATTNLKLNGGSIKLRNAENYTAAQFDIHLTDGSTINYLSLNSASDHQMTWKMVDANTCRVIVYSLSNAPFRTAKDELFNVTLSGNAMISNELLVNVDGMVTGINEMQFDKPVDVYDLRGNKVRSNTTDLNGLQKGVYIVNGKKVIVK